MVEFSTRFAIRGEAERPAREERPGSVSGYRGEPAPAVEGVDRRGQLLRSPVLHRLVFPLLFAILLAGSIELAIHLRYHPGFWQRTTWLMYNPYRGEIFDRVILYEKLHHFENSDPEVISVGDSSGFFGIQSTIVNRYTKGARYLSLNTGANYAYLGYRSVAEYMLMRSSHLKYVVIYAFPQIVPVPYILGVADLAPIVYDTMVGPLSYLTPPSAFLSPYVKYEAFDGYRFHAGDVGNHAVYGLQLDDTIDQALGWLPEFDIRVDRIGGIQPFLPDKRTDPLSQLRLRESSSVYATLDDFNNLVKSYGAILAIGYAPISRRAVMAADPEIPATEQALARFSKDHPEVKFLLPLIERWGPEKFGTANHVSREYTFLSSMRLGQAIGRLVTAPDSIRSYTPSFVDAGPSPTIDWKVTGPDDPDLRTAALALYLYTTTLDPHYLDRISRRVLELLNSEPAYRYMIHDAHTRVDMQRAKNIDIGFDLSELHARPIDVSGIDFCDPRPDTQWVEFDGRMIFTYRSPEFKTREPVRWPEASHIFIPTIFEDGVSKFDGYCPESSLPADLGK